MTGGGVELCGVLCEGDDIGLDQYRQGYGTVTPHSQWWPRRALPEVHDERNESTFTAVARFDVFRDEDIDFTQRLIAAGIPVDLHVHAHAWNVFAPQSGFANIFEQTWHDYLRRRLHG